MSAPAEPRVVWVLIPHPDDEFSAWSLLEDDGIYPVFVLLTHGEATAFAAGQGLQADLGERTPAPQPFHGPRSLYVRAQRLDSWHAFLDEIARLAGRPDRAEFRIHLPGAVPLDHGCDVFVGARTARVVFDLGDGHLTRDVVIQAFTMARREVLPLLPSEVDDAAVAAAFYNDRDPGPHYAHRDHQAVHEALWDHDFGLPGGQWGRTVRADPDVAGTGGRVALVSPGLYDAVMALGPDGRRTGALQRIYGWLGFQADGAFRPAPDPADEDVFSRSQAFWRRH